jgi:membrane protein
MGRLREVARAVDEHDLLTFASAIAFQVLSALVPLLLFAFGLIGFLHLDDVWQRDGAPAVRDAVSADVFRVVDSAIKRVLHGQQGFWVTAGAALSLWEVSGAVRAVMSALDRIHRVEEERSRRRRFAISFALAIAVGACLLGALVVGRFGPRTLGLAHASGFGAVLAFLVRYGVTAVLLGLAVGLLVRFGPACDQPLHFVSLGTGIVVVGWLIFSTGFGFYLAQVADYGSIFGSLASIFILLSYLYLSSFVFLLGAQVDVMVRWQLSGDRRPSQPEDATPRRAT